MSGAVAAVDCGTNSTRMLIHDGRDELERLMTITRLGAGVDTAGRLADAAVARTLDTLRDHRTRMDRHGVDRVRVTATAAVRDAVNRDEFLAPAAEIVGSPVEVLDGRAEAELSFKGATTDLDPGSGPFAVFDIGGGSTEIAVGTEEPLAAMSIDVGCVRLTERYIGSDPPRPEELLACLSITEAHLDDVAREMPELRTARLFVGLAGTVTTAAAVELGLAEYDRDAIHHFVLTKPAVEDVYRTLATESRADRVHNPGLEEARADVIVGGLCILVRIMRHFDVAEILVSESDLLDGLVQGLLRS